MHRALHSGFLHSVELFRERPAIEVGRRTLTYEELFAKAASIAATLQRRLPSTEPPLTAVFAYRSVTAFAGVLAGLFRGHGYVPLNRTFPPDRTRNMLLRSGCKAVIVDSESAKQLEDILLPVVEPMLVVMPDEKDVGELRSKCSRHMFLGARELERAEAWQPVSSCPNSIAYLLFTSGSTGTPKGVMISHANVSQFVDVMVERYQITERDRFSQNFEMTFDLSAFDMFVAWERGACVCCPSMKSLISPGRFIRESVLTVWFSVPSVGIFMKRLGVLKPDRYPSLRWSLFCGEALPADLAQDWAEAAPNSVIENLYGPTELTIACTAYRWNSTKSLSECQFGTVPIGKPYPAMSAIIVDDDLREVAPGGDGELLLTGPQLSLGYWKDPAKTASAFVMPGGKTEIYYRTGDRVRRPLREEDPIVYLGRIDNQVKVLGHRLELGEVEALLREQPGVDSAVAIGWPVTASGVGGVVAFVTGTKVKEYAIRTSLKAKLPPYAVPREIRVMPQLPMNVNGKIDRKALLSILEVTA
jgi:amino acid adenylation domain-containing protein